MPTYYRLGNIDIKIYPNDHGPAHIHAVGTDAEAVFAIENLEVLRNYGFSEKSLRRLRAYLALRKDQLMENWHENQS